MVHRTRKQDPGEQLNQSAKPRKYRKSRISFSRKGLVQSKPDISTVRDKSGYLWKHVFTLKSELEAFRLRRVYEHAGKEMGKDFRIDRNGNDFYVFFRKDSGPIGR